LSASICAFAVLATLSLFLIVELVKTRRRLRSYVDSVRVRDRSTNEAIDGTVAILKQLLELAVTSDFKSNPFLYRLVNKLLLPPNNPRSIFHHFDKVADCRYYGVLSEMRKKYGNLTEDDLLFCSFICFGFNPSAITLIYGHKNLQSYYNKRCRLRKRMGLGNEADHIKTYLQERMEILCSSQK